MRSYTGFIHPDIWSLSNEFTVINFLKFCLNELNNVVLVFYFSEVVKAEYSVINNLGGMIP